MTSSSNTDIAISGKARVHGVRIFTVDFPMRPVLTSARSAFHPSVAPTRPSIRSFATPPRRQKSPLKAWPFAALVILGSGSYYLLVQQRLKENEAFKNRQDVPQT